MGLLTLCSRCGDKEEGSLEIRAAYGLLDMMVKKKVLRYADWSWSRKKREGRASTEGPRVAEDTDFSRPLGERRSWR